MALRRTLSKGLSLAPSPEYPSLITTLVHPPVPPPSTAVQNITPRAQESTSTGSFRRYLQRRAINNRSYPNAIPSFLILPICEKLMERLKSMNVTRHQFPQFDELSLPPLKTAPEEGFRVGAVDAKRVLRFVQMEQIRGRLRNIPASTIPYGEFVGVCGDTCGNGEMGVEFAKALDESGNAIVLGGVVFLRPDEGRSMESIHHQTLTQLHTRSTPPRPLPRGKNRVFPPR